MATIGGKRTNLRTDIFLFVRHSSCEMFKSGTDGHFQIVRFQKSDGRTGGLIFLMLYAWSIRSIKHVQFIFRVS